MARTEDGSAGDADYSVVGAEYSRYRRADARIAAIIHAALGDAKHVLNVGAGAGSYEPTDRHVVAVEPSASMRAQRPSTLSKAVDAVAECLPFEDNRFDASMAIFTIHQWPEAAKGLNELRRVTQGPVAILTCDPEAVQSFWLNDYAPQVLAAEAQRYPKISSILSLLRGPSSVAAVPIPYDCSDGFNEAYFGRPERLLEESARLACSAWSFVDSSVAKGYVLALEQDLNTGAWDRRYGHLRSQPHYSGSLRLITCQP
jgi:hypothetical protein